MYLLPMVEEYVIAVVRLIKRVGHSRARPDSCEVQLEWDSWNCHFSIKLHVHTHNGERQVNSYCEASAMKTERIGSDTEGIYLDSVRGVIAGRHLGRGLYGGAC